MCLKLPHGLILMWVCCASGVVVIEAKTLRETCTYMDEGCICRHHVPIFLYSTPVINEVSSGNQEEMQERKFGGRTHVQENFGYCSFLLQTGTITAVRDTYCYSDLLQDGLKDHLHLFICDWICEKGSYTRNYKYLEIQF